MKQRSFAKIGILLALWSGTVLAQGRGLSARSRTLTDALQELRKAPNDATLQEKYLKAFPRDYKEFLTLFEPDQELYDGHDFIEILPSLATNCNVELGRLLVNLSKDARWDADAPNYLQDATAKYGSQHTETLVDLMRRLSPGERSNLITFLADAENHDGYPEYQAIVDHLRTLGETRLAREFEVARKNRSKRHHSR